MLLHKLNYCGLNGEANDLCRSYLLNRKQYGEFENIKSEESVIPLVFPGVNFGTPLIFLFI